MPTRPFASLGAARDRTAAPRPRRRVGETLVRSNARMSSFLATQDPPAGDEWVHSGDLGYLAEGELFVTERMEDLIISGGRNIHTEAIEARAQGLPQLRPGRAAAFRIEDPAAGTGQIVLMCETRGALAPDEHWTAIRELRLRTHQSLQWPWQAGIVWRRAGPSRTPAARSLAAPIATSVSWIFRHPAALSKPGAPFGR
jgi:acyl-CoA synthetase (AMP-forming)/AMP-acid ligase II